MSNNTNTPARPGGLSLYANLLDPTNTSTPGSIAKAPIIFKNATPDSTEDAAAKKPQIDAAALRFQPTKRPQLQQQKPKPKAHFPKAVVADTTSSPSITSNATPASKPVVKPTLADWANVEQDEYYEQEKRQRGGRKKRKKNNREEHQYAQDWDDIYDPSRPNNYEEYKNSDEKIREVREWKDRLYAHRMARKSIDKDSDDEEDYKPRFGNQFAPPSNYSFAPPPIDSPPPPPPKPEIKEENAFESVEQVPPPPPPPATAAGSISRAPVRYNLPAAPSDIPSSEAELAQALAEEEDAETRSQEDQSEKEEEEAPRSLRPGQKGFAERLMSKYGWSKGTGLGADGSGITTALRVQVDKGKKKKNPEAAATAVGIGAAGGGRGKIIGGKKKAGTEEGGRFGPMSSVIVLRGMVDGMDLDEEMVGGEGQGGLMQEIGEECGEKYGRVERVFISRHETAPRVFVKFTAELSALRAVNALEGRIFNGNTITALFYDEEAFEQGVYDK